MDFLEITVTVLGLTQGVLVMLNKRSNWIVYIAQMALLAAFSFWVCLYGDMLSSIIYIIVGITGFVLWGKEKSSKITVATTKERLVYISIILIGTVVGYFYLKSIGDVLPLLDAFTTTSGIVATYYMLTKKIDTWFIWFINDIAYVITYFLLPDQGIYLMALNIIWTFMAIASYVTWKKIMDTYSAENIAAIKKGE